MRRSVSLVVVAAVAWTCPLVAHNEVVHRDMTDRAFEIMLAVSHDVIQPPPGVDAAEMGRLVAAIKGAVPKLRRLPSGLPQPKQSTCAEPALIQKIGSSSPGWGATSLSQVQLLAVRYPVSIGFITGNDCGIDSDWTPGAFFDTVNTGGISTRDHTGATLGFWAQHPDGEVDDIHIFHRPTNAAGLSIVKQYITKGVGAVAATVWVPAKCLVECALNALTFGIVGDCKQCLDNAIQQADTAAHDGVGAIDGLIPGVFDGTDPAMYGGMPHHVNVATTAPAVPPALWPTRTFDDRPGMLTERGGPFGVPDQIEAAALLVADGLGMTLHYDPSLSPKRYEIRGVSDFHPDSTHRTETDWELFSWPHTPFTPVDNLGMFGWQQFRRVAGDGWTPSTQDPLWNAKYLGWPLHAIGEAVAPMHLAGTFGWGHRPFEDAVMADRGLLLYQDDRDNARRQAGTILGKALRWRQTVLQWRAAHPEKGADVPVRILVTELANWTFGKIQGPGMLAWPFSPAMSSAYLTPGGKGLSIEYYRNPLQRATNRELLEEAVAATLAFLTSAGEVLP